jgi:hypothetical protein
MQSLLAFFSRHRMALIYGLLLLAWGLRVEHRYHYRNWFIDTEVQLTASAQWWMGHGYSVPMADPSDLSQTHYEPSSVFMPGYGWLVLPFFEWLDDWLLAALWSYALAMALMLIAIHLIWRQQRLQHDQWPYLAYLLFVGFSPAPWHYLTDAGQWSLTAFAWAVLALLHAGPSSRRRHAGTLLAIGFLAGGALIRYAYLPYLLLPALLWTLPRHQLSERWRSLVLAGTSGLLGLGLIWGWRVSTLSYLPGEGGESGWFPHHLLALDPFPFKAFFYYGIPHELTLAEWAAWLPLWLRRVATTASLVILLTGVYLWFNWRSRDGFPARQRRRLLRLFVFTLLLTLGMLGYLSLRTPPQSWNWTGFWTYVMETRYYAPLLWLIGLITFLSVQDVLRPSLIRGLTFTVLTVTLVNLGFGTYQRWALYQGEGWGKTFAQSNVPDLMAAAAKHQRQGPGPVRVMSFQDIRSPGMLGLPVIDYQEGLLTRHFPTSRPVQLLVLLPLPAAQSPVEKAWLRHFSPQILKRLPQGVLYHLLLLPETPSEPT